MDDPKRVRIDLRDERGVRARAVVRERRVLVRVHACKVAVDRRSPALVHRAEPRRVARHGRLVVLEVRERVCDVLLRRGRRLAQRVLLRGVAARELRALRQTRPWREGESAARECRGVGRDGRTERGDDVACGEEVEHV